MFNLEEHYTRIRIVVINLLVIVKFTSETITSFQHVVEATPRTYVELFISPLIDI